MPSTYSTNLALELMATGEDNNTWGDITNVNLGTLLEQSIVSQATVAMSDATTTIAMSNGASCEARCIVLNLTGALTAQRNLVVPTINKPYVVLNSTTGGYGVQVKTSAGTGIVVPNGKRRFLFADGTNVVQMIDSIGSLTVDTFALAGATSGSTTISPAAVASGTWTLPATTDTFVGRATTDTLSNKTLVAPALGTPASGNLANCTAFPVSGLTGTTLPASVVASSLTSVGTLTSLAVAGVTTVSTNNAAPLQVTRAAAGANVSVQISNNDGSWFVGKGSGGDFNVDTDSTIGTSPKLALTSAGALSVASLALTGAATVGTTLGVSGATTLTGDFTANSNVVFNGTLFQCNADLYAGRMGASILASTTTHLNIDAGTTGVSSLRIAAGVAPTAPVNGDVWATTTALFIRLNGVTKTFTLT